MNEIDAIINKYFNNNAEIIEQNIPESFSQIIETFVSFYGEEYRSKIEDVFSRTKIFVAPPDICDLVEEMNKEIYDYLSKKYEEYRDYFKLENDFIRFDTFYFSLLPDDVRKELEEIKNKLEQYEKLYNTHSELSTKLFVKYRESSYEKASNDIKEILKNELNYPDEVLENIHFLEQDWFWIGSLEELQEHRINKDNDNYFETLGQIKSFLNALGIEVPKMKALSYPEEYTDDDYENDKKIFEEFLNMEYLGRKIRDYLPNRKIGADIKFKWKDIYKKGSKDKDIEYHSMLYGNKFLLPSYLGYDPDFMISSCKYILGGNQTCLVKKENVIRLGNIIFLSSKNITIEDAGCILIHELNHALESGVKYTENGNYNTISGWDISPEQDAETHEIIGNNYKCFRDYELFNEVINEFITLELFEIIKRKSSGKIFEKNHLSGYRHAYFILNDFYNMYKDKIILSRQQNNLEIMYEAVGKDNFVALASLLREFSSCLYGGEFDYYKAVQEREAGIQSEMTKMLTEAERRRDEIMAAMMEYSKNSNKSRGIIDIKILIIIVILIILIILFCLF